MTDWALETTTASSIECCVSHSKPRLPALETDENNRSFVCVFFVSYLATGRGGVGEFKRISVLRLGITIFLLNARTHPNALPSSLTFF